MGLAFASVASGDHLILFEVVQPALQIDAGVGAGVGVGVGADADVGLAAGQSVAAVLVVPVVLPQIFVCSAAYGDLNQLASL